MAFAVVKHAELVAYANEQGFPLYTKVSCRSGTNGYKLWDEWIKNNVTWVSGLTFDPETEVKITESAQLVGELIKPWELRSQKFVEGELENNSFNTLKVDEAEYSTHVNRKAIMEAVSAAEVKYKIDYEVDTDGLVVTWDKLAIAIFNNAADTSLSYQTDIEVAQLWTTKVEDVLGQHVMYKRAYADQPNIEESYPWLLVGVLTPKEFELWSLHAKNDGKSFQHLLDQAAVAIDSEFS